MLPFVYCQPLDTLETFSDSMAHCGAFVSVAHIDNKAHNPWFRVNLDLSAELLFRITLGAAIPLGASAMHARRMYCCIRASIQGFVILKHVPLSVDGRCVVVSPINLSIIYA